MAACSFLAASSAPASTTRVTLNVAASCPRAAWLALIWSFTVPACWGSTDTYEAREAWRAPPYANVWSDVQGRRSAVVAGSVAASMIVLFISVGMPAWWTVAPKPPSTTFCSGMANSRMPAVVSSTGRCTGSSSCSVVNAYCPGVRAPSARSLRASAAGW